MLSSLGTAAGIIGTLAVALMGMAGGVRRRAAFCVCLSGADRDTSFID